MIFYASGSDGTWEVVVRSPDFSRACSAVIEHLIERGRDDLADEWDGDMHRMIGPILHTTVEAR